MATPNYINVGPAPNDGLGDPLRTAFQYSNDWFAFLNSRVQTTPPITLTGTVGDQAGMYAYDSTYFYYCFANYDGISTIWAQVAQIGNVSVPFIVNGSTTVDIPSAGSNVTFTIGGVPNVVVVGTSAVSVNGSVTASSFNGSGTGLSGVVLNSQINSDIASYLPTYSGALYPAGIFTNGYYYANGVPFSGGGGGGGSYGDSNVATYLPTYTGDIGGTLTTAAQPNVTSVGTLTGLTINGALTANGIGAVTLDPISANVSLTPTFGGQVIINSSGTGSMNNMVIGATNPQSGKFTNVSATANVTAQYFIGDGSLLTNVGGGGGGNYTDANVAAYLPTYTGNISASNINVSNSVSVTGTTTSTQIAGQLTGTINGINPTYGVWDFGSITGTTFESPIAWIFAQTSAGNIDMGSITVPSSNDIDIGTIY